MRMYTKSFLNQFYFLDLLRSVVELTSVKMKSTQTPSSDIAINYRQKNENEMQVQTEPPFKIVSDTKDLFHGSSSFQDPQE